MIIPVKPPERRKVTQADVARFAGVSSAVVSYVVNGGPKNVAAGTRERVREAIDLLSYRPNLSARALRRGTTDMIGLVVPDSRNPFFAEFAYAIELAAGREGHALVIANSSDDAITERRLVADLASRQVDGLLVATAWPWQEILGAWPSHVPMVLLNSEEAVPGRDSLGPNFFQGAKDAVEHLIRIHGHDSVALAVGEIGGRTANSRQQGWLAALTEAGLRAGQVERGPFTREGGYDISRRLFEGPRPPRAILASSDLQAIGLTRAIHERGSDPEDVALVSFDGTIESEFCWPPLTVARQPIRAMADAAMATLLNQGPTQEHRMFDVELVVRRSCGCHATPPSITA